MIIHGKPFVVLRNDGGCVIACKAKELGILMGTPAFE